MLIILHCTCIKLCQHEVHKKLSDKICVDDFTTITFLNYSTDQTDRNYNTEIIDNTGRIDNPSRIDQTGRINNTAKQTTLTELTTLTVLN